MRRSVTTGRPHVGWARLRRIALLIGAVAFLLQVTAWMVGAPAMAAGMTVPVCTTDGVLLVQFGPDGQPAADKADPTADHEAMGCPLCPLVQGLSLPPPVPAPVTPAELLRHGPTMLPGERIAAGWFHSTLQARAPPVAG